MAVREGVERLLLLRRHDEAIPAAHATEIAWMLPIPAQAAQVHARAFRGLPTFSGQQPLILARRTTETLMELMLATQLWTLPPLMARFWGDYLEPSDERPPIDGATQDSASTEVLTATSVGSLLEELRERGVDIPTFVWPSLESLATPERAWVLLRVNGHLPMNVGVAITFPSAHGYYPLMALPGLRSSMRDIEITTLGFARAIAPALPELTTSFYVGSYQTTAIVRQDGDIELSGDRERFTRFRLSGSVAEATEIQFEPGAPPAVIRAAEWMEWPLHTALEGVIALLAFVALSLGSYFGVRAVWPRGARPDRRHCAQMPAANLVTILGPLALAARRGQPAGVSSRRSMRFVLAASAALSALLFCLRWLNESV